MTDPLFVNVRPESREDRALRAWMAERRRAILEDLASLHCDTRNGDIFRGRIAELAELERALTVPPLPNQPQE
jgi:hypothetical protein